MASRISPLEIKQKTFTKKSLGGGYDKDEVAAFLQAVSQEFEKIQDQSHEQSIKIDFLEKEIAKLKEVESSLFKTLRAAEETCSNMIEQAKKNAEIKLREAQLNADALMNETRGQARALIQKSQLKARNIMNEVLDELKLKERDYHTIETYRDNLVIDVKNFIQNTMTKLDQLESKNTQDYFLQKMQEVKLMIEEKQSQIDQSKSNGHEVNTEATALSSTDSSFFDDINS